MDPYTAVHIVPHEAQRKQLTCHQRLVLEIRQRNPATRETCRCA